MKRGASFALAFVGLLFATLSLFPAHAETFYVEGEGGVPLAVTVAGPPEGPEILFLHGLGMGAESFAPQLESELAEKFRMVSFDLRGHAMSGKPWAADAYIHREAWAGDVKRVIAASGLRRPVIVAWSYGTLVAADYLLAEGVEWVSGLVFVSALGGLITPNPPATAPDPEIMAQLSRSRELRKSARLEDLEEAVEILQPMLFETTQTGPSAEWQSRARILGMLVPPYAQAHLRAHPNDNAALAAQLVHTPVLVIRGERDLALNDDDLASFRVVLPEARIRSYPAAGHSPFAEQPAAFNQEIGEFVSTHWRGCAP